MTAQDIGTFFAYDAWATERTLESVAALSEELYRKDLGSSHGGIHGTLVHLYGAGLTWLQRWKGRSASPAVSVAEVPTLRVLAGLWKDNRSELDDFVRGITDAALAAPLPYADRKGNPHAEPLFQQMLQVVNHGSYHRGQVVTMLRQVGGTPTATDLIMFYRTRMG
jgi:uncharacterized damage-inducible protein DinB